MSKGRQHKDQKFPLTPDELQVFRGQRLWLHLEEMLQNQLELELERIQTPVSSDTLSSHNVRIGRIQMLRELISYPDRINNLSSKKA